MLRPLPLSSLRVVLLPREASTLPFVKHVFNEILAKRSIELARLDAVWGRDGSCNGLKERVNETIEKRWRERTEKRKNVREDF